MLLWTFWYIICTTFVLERSVFHQIFRSGTFAVILHNRSCYFCMNFYTQILATLFIQKMFITSLLTHKKCDLIMCWTEIHRKELISANFCCSSSFWRLNQFWQHFTSFLEVKSVQKSFFEFITYPGTILAAYPLILERIWCQNVFQRWVKHSVLRNWEGNSENWAQLPLSCSCYERHPLDMSLGVCGACSTQ